MLAAAAAHGADTIYGSVLGTHFPGNQGSFGGMALAVQHAGSQGGVVVGLSDTDFPDGSLSECDVDAYRVTGSGWSVTGGASLGQAVSDTETSTLYKARVYADGRLDSSWWAHVGYQYIDLDVIHGQILTPGIEYRPDARWGLKVGGGYAPGGTLAGYYETVELDRYLPQHLFAGLILGRTGYDPATLGQVSVVQRLFQAYAGASFPMARGTLTVGLESIDLEGAWRQTLRLGITQPLRP
jgi:hypothetical protein